MPLIAIGFLKFTVIDLIDIAVVAALIYIILRWVRKSSSMNIIIAIIVLLLARVVSDTVGMRMVSTILGALIDVGTIALVVIFQPEIRTFLYRIGRRTVENAEGSSLLERIFGKRESNLAADALDELAQACFEMASEKCGALIVIRRRDSLEDIIGTGDLVDAQISRPLIENIFFKNSPLHDGAMIIGGGRIVAARCTLPITASAKIPARYGMRHKAAVGISEKSDAKVIVVSEQTGKIAFVQDGTLQSVDNINTLKLLIGNDERKAGDKDRVR